MFQVSKEVHAQIHLSALRLSQKAPSGINPLEHEELPMSVQQVQQNVKPTLAAVPQKSTERHHGAFSQVNALPRPVFVRPNDPVSLYRAHMDNRGVILRVLKGKVSCSEEVFFNVALVTATGNERSKTGSHTLKF